MSEPMGDPLLEALKRVGRVEINVTYGLIGVRGLAFSAAFLRGMSVRDAVGFVRNTVGQCERCAWFRG